MSNSWACPPEQSRTIEANLAIRALGIPSLHSNPKAWAISASPRQSAVCCPNFAMTDCRPRRKRSESQISSWINDALCISSTANPQRSASAASAECTRADWIANWALSILPGLVKWNRYASVRALFKEVSHCS